MIELLPLRRLKNTRKKNLVLVFFFLWLVLHLLNVHLNICFWNTLLRRDCKIRQCLARVGEFQRVTKCPNFCL
ncbi:hypothetical protein L1887_01822 [Cichorium endivia]|nr:hypothetical protein L1887_01822 [Cichorium endivia]